MEQVKKSPSTDDLLSQIDGRPVLIFDGVCNLCNFFVDFVMRRDRRQQFLFTANQHKAGQELLRTHGYDVEDVSTVFLYQNGKMYERSEAALRVARMLGFPWSLAWVGMILPRFLRDGIYKWIASNRYRWFGQKETCRLPTPAERARFLP